MGELVTEMGTKEWLKRYGNAKLEVERLELEREAIRETMNGVHAIQYNDMPKNQSTMSDLSDTIMAYEQMNEQITEKQKQMQQIMDEVRSVINMLSVAKYRQVLTLKYINLMEWDSIFKKMDYSPRRVFQLHAEALGAVSRFI